MEFMPEATSEHKYNVVNSKASVPIENNTHKADEKYDDREECAIIEKDETMFCTDSICKSNEYANSLNETNEIMRLQCCLDSSAKHYNSTFTNSSARCSESNCKYRSSSSRTGSNIAVEEAYSDVYVAPNTPYICDKCNRKANCFESNKNEIARTSSSDVDVHLGCVVANVNNSLENCNVISNSISDNYFASKACGSKEEYNVSDNNSTPSSSSSQVINSQQLQPYFQLLRRQMQNKIDKSGGSNYRDEEKTVSPIFTYAFQRKLANRLRQKVAEAHNNSCGNINATLSKLHKVHDNANVETEQGVADIFCNQVSKCLTLPLTFRENNKFKLSIHAETLEQPYSEQQKPISQELNKLHSSETSKEGKTDRNTIANVDANKTHSYFVNSSPTINLTEREEVARTLFASPMHSELQKNVINKRLNENSIVSSGEEENITELCLPLSTLHKTPTSTTSIHSSNEVSSCKEHDLSQKRKTKQSEHEQINEEKVKLIDKKTELHYSQEEYREQKKQERYGYKQKKACAQKSTPLCNVPAVTLESENALNKIWEECVEAKLKVALEKWQAVVFMKIVYLSMYNSLRLNQIDNKQNDIEADTSLHSHLLKEIMECRVELSEAIGEAERASKYVAEEMRLYVEKMNAVILQLLNTRQYSFALQLLLKADELVKDGAGMEFVLDKLTCNKQEINSKGTKPGVNIAATSNTKIFNMETESITRENVNSISESTSNTMYIDEIDIHVLASCCETSKTQNLPLEYCKFDTVLLDNIVLPITVHLKHAIIHRSSTKSLEAQRVQEMLSLHIPYFISAETQERVYCTSITYNNFGLYHYHIGEYALAVVRLQEAASLESQLQQQQQEYVKLPGVTYFNLAEAQFMAYKQENRKHCNNYFISGSSSGNHCFHKSQTYNFFRSLERATQLTIDKLLDLTWSCEQYVRLPEEKEEHQRKDEQEEEFSDECNVDDSFIVYQTDNAGKNNVAHNQTIEHCIENKFTDNFANDTKEDCSDTRSITLWLRKREQLCLLVQIKMVETEMYVSFHEYKNALQSIDRAVMWCKEIPHRMETEERQLETIVALQRTIRQKCAREELERVMYGRTVEHNHRKSVKKANYTVKNNKWSTSTIFNVNSCENNYVSKCSENPFELLHAKYTSIPVLSVPYHNCRNNTLLDGHTHVATTLLPRTIHIIGEVHRNPFGVPQSTNSSELPCRKHNFNKCKTNQPINYTSSKVSQKPVGCTENAEFEHRPFQQQNHKTKQYWRNQEEQEEWKINDVLRGVNRCKTASHVEPIAGKHASPYMARQHRSSASLRTRKAWDNDTHTSNTKTTYAKQEQVKNRTAAESRERSNNEDEIDIRVTNVENVGRQKECEDNNKSNMSNISGEGASENMIEKVERVCKHKDKSNSYNNKKSLSSLELSSSISTSTIFGNRLRASCEQSKNVNMILTLISCVDIINAFIRCKLSKCEVEMKSAALSERRYSTSCKSPSLLVQSTQSSEENYKNDQSRDEDSDKTENKKNKNDRSSSTSTSSTSISNNSSSDPCVMDIESKPTKSFEMLFVHSGSKKKHSDCSISSEENDTSDDNPISNVQDETT